MFFFFFFDDSGAVSAFQAAVQAEKTTYEAVAKRIGVSRGTLTKFMAGRPLSPDVLSKIIHGFPADHAQKILIGHLNDEIGRSGWSGSKLQIIKQTRHSYILDQAARLMDQNAECVGDLAKLIEKWEKQDPSKSSEPAIPSAKSKSK